MITPQPKFPRWTATSLAVAVGGNLLAASFPVYSLLNIPPGSAVRLMVEAFHAGITSLVTFPIVMFLAILGLRKERYRWLVVIAICLSLTPFFFSGWAMNQVAKMRGIEFKP